MMCSKQASLVKEWSMDGFPNVDAISTSCLDGKFCLPFMSDSMFSVTVTGIDSLIHSLILILLFKVLLNVEVIASFWSSCVIFL